MTNVDQLTIIFWYVLPVGPMERVFKFIPTRGNTGHQLADLLFEFIEENDIFPSEERVGGRKGIRP